MKKTLTTTLTGAALIAVIGLLFKLLHWPGANYMLVLSLSTISLTAFLRLLQEEGVSSKIGAIAGGLLPIGLLFKLMRWPNGQQIIYIAIGFALLSIGLMAFAKKEEGN